MPRLGGFGELIPVRGFSRHPKRSIGARSAWCSHDGLVVVSGRELAHLPGTHPPVPGDQWLVSVSRSPDRASSDDAQRVVECFAMPAFDEDNHHPGIARHLWCPVDEQYRHACECKLTEELIVDDDGYEWTNDTSAPCRGCELGRLTGRPCPLHVVEVSSP